MSNGLNIGRKWRHVVRKYDGGLTKNECHSTSLPRSQRHEGVVDTPQERGLMVLHMVVGTNGTNMTHTVGMTLRLVDIKFRRSTDEREGRDANEPIGIRSVIRGFDERQSESLPEGIRYADGLVTHQLAGAGAAVLGWHGHIDGVVGVTIVDSSMTISHDGTSIWTSLHYIDMDSQGADLLHG